MVQTASLFSQLLHEVPRNEFARLVNRHQGERHAKGFTCWAQFTAMLFCQLAHADSLREICNGLACCVGKLVHLGINRGPSKSNLSYANVHRPARRDRSTSTARSRKTLMLRACDKIPRIGAAISAGLSPAVDQRDVATW